jgi:hypothetical protein
LIEFSPVNVDSACLMKGFLKAQQTNDSTFTADFLNSQALADSSSISLDELDAMEDNAQKEIILKPPSNKRYTPHTKQDNADRLHKLYRNFEKAVLEGRIKLNIIDTANQRR